VVHVVHREGLGPVFEAMVLEPIAGLLTQGCPVQLCCFTPLGQLIRPAVRRAWFARLSAAERKVGRVRILPSPPSRARSLWNEARILDRRIRRDPGADSPLILHCRGPHATSLGLAVRSGRPRTAVVFDMRGIAHAEYLYEQARTEGRSRATEREAAAQQLLAMEAGAARAADALFCVSKAMADHVVAAYGVDRAKIRVTPCCVRLGDTSGRRSAIRRRLGMEGRFVVAFCGSSHLWQLPRESGAMFLAIKALDPSAHYLVLTPGAARMRDLLARLGIPPGDLTVLSAAHDDVPGYLEAADLGLLLRERSLVNQVASPVKFAEYMASGVPVVISDGIGDYTGLVRERGAGVVVDGVADSPANSATLSEFLSGYRSDPGAMRRRCRAVAEQVLPIDRVLDEWQALYRTLAADLHDPFRH
jgi:glycosyltransferase involved in cell wall biosynthesis